jgi:hypothetical protein
MIMAAGLRAIAKAVGNPPEPKVCAPVLDLTDERGVETGSWQGYLGTARRKGRQKTNQTYSYRATSRLYRPGCLGKLPAGSRPGRGGRAQRRHRQQCPGFTQPMPRPRPRNGGLPIHPDVAAEEAKGSSEGVSREAQTARPSVKWT